MSRRLLQPWPVHLLISVAVSLMLVGACGPALISTSPTGLVVSSSPQPEVLPEFLVRVNPRPGRWSVAGMEQANAEIKTTVIANEGEVLGAEDIKKRTEFFLDGKKTEIIAYPSISPDVVVFSKAELTVGSHQATIRVQKTSGEMLEYSWSFSTLDQEPRMAGLPSGVLGVRPVPGSMISLRQYEEEQLLSRDYVPLPGDLSGMVCIGVVNSIVDPTKEGMDYQALVSKVGLSLDGRPLVIDEAVTDGVHLRHCSRQQLTPGAHHAIVEIQEPAGVVTYTWAFTITENAP